MSAVRAFLAGHWQLLLLTALVLAFWRSGPAFPFRLLIVLFHELSHGAAALLTGGEIVRIEVSRQEGGAIWTRGGNGFLISSAGYLGSLLIGLGLLILAIRTGADRLTLGLCGGLILVSAVVYVRDIFSLGFSLSAAAMMLVIACLLRREAADLALRIIGLLSILYVPWDIWSDTIRGNSLTGRPSDAAGIAARSFGTEVMWGVIWLILGLVAIIAALRLCLRRPSNVEFLGR